MNNLQQQGRVCYKKGEYAKAIECFDRAIGRASSVQLLDNRAACHEKRNDLPKALRDAKSAIQLHREDPTGYLRAGKILLKMEKPVVALEIYTHGLRCIKHVGQGFELLQKAHKDLMDKTSPPKSVDPMTVLPRELAILILQTLSFQQRMNACLVSKAWAELIQSFPDLWTHLDLSQSRRKVRTSFISRAINVARDKMTAATLSNVHDFDKTLAAISKHCQLRDLTLLEVGMQASNLTQLLISAKHLTRLCMGLGMRLSSDEFPRLLVALSDRIGCFECDFGGPWPSATAFPLLHTLSLRYRYLSSATPIFVDVAERMPSLKSLTVHADEGDYSNWRSRTVDLERCSHLVHLDLKLPLRFAAQLNLPTTLVKLKLQSTLGTLPVNFWFTAGEAGLEPFRFFLPRLEELELEIPRMIAHNTLHAIHDTRIKVPDAEPDEPLSLSKLRRLAVRGATLNYIQISELLKHSRLVDLEDLHLPRLASCGDQDVAHIMESMPRLRSLDLSETNITGVGVKYALKSGCLRELIVNNCANIGLDAIAWAREQGVRVHHRMSDGSNGGKRVRN